MRAEKQMLLDEICGHMARHNAFLIVSYQKLGANKVGEFRRDVRKGGGEVEMVRKRVLEKAAQAAGIQIKAEALPGHIGLVFTGKDPIETTKLVYRYAKELDKSMEVVGGHLDGRLYNASEMATLSTLPGKDEMRAQLLAVFVAPLSHTLGTMDALLTSVMHCLENKQKADMPS